MTTVTENLSFTQYIVLGQRIEALAELAEPKVGLFLAQVGNSLQDLATVADGDKALAAQQFRMVAQFLIAAAGAMQEEDVLILQEGFRLVGQQLWQIKGKDGMDRVSFVPVARSFQEQLSNPQGLKARGLLDYLATNFHRLAQEYEQA